MELNPQRLRPDQRYKLLAGAVVPRPIAWVSTRSGKGLDNLAPFSFFNGVGGEPMTVAFCPANEPDGTPKDTLRNIDETGEFVVHVVPASLRLEMAATAEPAPHGESEFDLAGVAREPSCVVGPPRIAGAPVAFECALETIVRLTEPGTPNGANVVVGRVVWVRADDAVIDERLRIDGAALNAVGRMAGAAYCYTRDTFDMPSGVAALEKPDAVG